MSHCSWVWKPQNLKGTRWVNHGTQSQALPVSACSICLWCAEMANHCYHCNTCCCGKLQICRQWNKCFFRVLWNGKAFGSLVSYQVKHSFYYHVDISWHSSQISTTHSLNTSSTMGYQLLILQWEQISIFSCLIKAHRNRLFALTKLMIAKLRWLTATWHEN